MNTHTIGILAGILNCTLIIPYIYSIFKGDTKPNRITWFIWSFLAWVLLLASLQSGAKATTFWLLAAAINSTLVAIISIWKGVSAKDPLDMWCFFLGVGGVVLWIITRRAELSVYISALVDIIAIIPTVRKVWHAPSSEPKISWTGGFISALLNVAAIDSTKFAIILPPFVVIGWHLMVLIPMYFKKNSKSLR